MVVFYLFCCVKNSLCYNLLGRTRVGTGGPNKPMGMGRQGRVGVGLKIMLMGGSGIHF
jgi:hypothetical protein